MAGQRGAGVAEAVEAVGGRAELVVRAEQRHHRLVHTDDLARLQYSQLRPGNVIITRGSGLARTCLGNEEISRPISYSVSVVPIPHIMSGSPPHQG